MTASPAKLAQLLGLFLILSGAASAQDGITEDKKNTALERLPGAWSLDEAQTRSLNPATMKPSEWRSYAEWSFEKSPGKKLPEGWRKDGLTDADVRAGDADKFAKFMVIAAGNTRRGEKQARPCFLAQAHGSTWLLYFVPNYGIMPLRVQLVPGPAPQRDLLFLQISVFNKTLTLAFQRKAKD